MNVPIAQARKDLSQILKQTRQAPVIVTRRGEPNAVILSFQEYEHLRRLQAYLSMLRISRELANCGVTATELYEASRRELEEKDWRLRPLVPRVTKLRGREPSSHLVSPST